MKKKTKSNEVFHNSGFDDVMRRLVRVKPENKIAKPKAAKTSKAKR